MTPTDPPALRDLAVEVAREAAAEARRLRNRGLDIATKSSPTDLVTTADRATEELIRRRLAETRPHDEVVGEELGGDRGGGGPSSLAEVRWLVDPIDGTTNYVYDHPGWSVSIAAEVEGSVVAAAVVDAGRGSAFAAARGEGATEAGRPLHLADPRPLGEVLLATGFGYSPERRRAQARTLVGVLGEVRDIRRMGSAAVDLCSVAAGRVDAYYEWGLQVWDYAAGALIAAEAGARVADLDGGSPRPDGRILAAHPGRWDELARLLDAAGADDGSD